MSGKDEHKRIKDALDRLMQLDRKMYVNANTPYYQKWRNIPLVQEGYELLKSIPDDLREYTPGLKEHYYIHVKMHAPYLDCPRLCLEIEEKIRALYMKRKDQSELKYAWKASNERYRKLNDYINSFMSLETFCRKYDIKQVINPLARTAEWENVIYEASKEAAGAIQSPDILKDNYNDIFFYKLNQVLRSKGIGAKEEHGSGTDLMVKEAFGFMDRVVSSHKKGFRGGESRVVKMFDDMILIYDRFDLHVLKSALDNCWDWFEMKITNEDRFRKDIQLGIELFGSLSPDKKQDWETLAMLIKNNHPAVFMNDLEEFYDILKKAAAESAHEEVVQTAKTILKMIWEEEI